jgi:hypothetical protein
MRRARARAAAVSLALALGTPGCGLVDSLTPFGVGTQDYGGGVENVNGNWAGKTGNGGDVTFQVGNNTVSSPVFLHVTPDCTWRFESLTIVAPVVDSVFTIEIPYDQGRFVATGRFTSASACSGTYFFEGLGAGVCPTAGTGSFTANR